MALVIVAPTSFSLICFASVFLDFGTINYPMGRKIFEYVISPIGMYWIQPRELRQSPRVLFGCSTPISSPDVVCPVTVHAHLTGGF